MSLNKFYIAIKESYVLKILILTSVFLTSLSAIWYAYSHYKLDVFRTYIMLGGLIVAFTFAVATVYRKRWSLPTSMCFSFFGGIFVGTYSYYLEKKHPSITLQSLVLVFASMVFMLLVFKTIYKPSKRFEYWLDFATKLIIICYFSSMILGIFGISVPILFSNDAYGITFSVIVISVISSRYLMNYDLIQTSKHLIRKHTAAIQYMAWFCSFAMMVTIIWLFIEYLHLITKLRH